MYPVPTLFTADVCFFPYGIPSFEPVRIGKPSVCISVPPFVVNRMKLYAQGETVHVAGKEIEPIFFPELVSEKALIACHAPARPVFELIENLEDFALGSRNKTLWVFGTPDYVHMLVQSFQESDCNVYVHEFNAEYPVFNLRLDNSIQEKEKRFLPHFTSFDTQLLCAMN